MRSEKNKQSNTLYVIVLTAYDLEAHFTTDQTSKYEVWRKTLITKLDTVASACMCPNTCDTILSELFPDMVERINKGYGSLLDQG